MHPSPFARAGLLALSLAIIVAITWEIHLRNDDLKIAYDDNEALWADKRGMVYRPAGRTTVFIGSSRIKYDLDIPTWQELTGTQAVQLANVGSSPVPVLADLANDPEFKGKLIVDVVEGLFFFPPGSPNDVYTAKKINYYHHITPTQRFSFQVNRILESEFMFLDQDNYSFDAMLDNARLLPPRPDVFPGLYFPKEFGQVTFDRQSYMTPKFVADTNLQNQVTAIWTFLSSRIMGQAGAPGGPDSMLVYVKGLTDKIKARGGEVLFVRPPSSGPVKMGEEKAFPREKYWDRLLSFTGCQGIYYLDYPATSNFICPEWSHLKPSDVVIYTKNLVKILEEEKGWSFNKKTAAL
jgi:hypothetical protein